MAIILIGSGGLNDAAVDGHIARAVNSHNLILMITTSCLTYSIAGGQRTSALTLSVDSKITIDFDNVLQPRNCLKRKAGSEAGTVVEDEMGVTAKLEGITVGSPLDGNIIGDYIPVLLVIFTEANITFATLYDGKVGTVLPVAVGIDVVGR